MQRRALQAQLIVGEVAQFHFREGVCVDGRIDLAKLDPVGRIGACSTARCGGWWTCRRSGAPFSG